MVPSDNFMTANILPSITETQCWGASRGCRQAILFSLPKLQRALSRGRSGTDTVDREIRCRNCGAPLASRKGDLVLKYFMVQKPEHAHRLSKSVAADKEAHSQAMSLPVST